MKAYRVPLGAAAVAAAVSVLLLSWSGDPDDAARRRHGATSKPAKVESAARTPADATSGADDSWILLLSVRSGRNVLYKMRPDGVELTPVFGGELEGMPGLANGTTWYREPHWSRQSPDGRSFLSWAVDRGLPQQSYRMPPRYLLHLGRMGGGPTRIITPDATEMFAWSPDSRRFAYARSLWGHPATISHPVETRTQLVVAAVDGSGESVLLDRPGCWEPKDWSPDGTRLLVSYMSTPIMQKSSSGLFELDIAAAETGVGGGGPPARRPEEGGEEKVAEGGGLRAILPVTRGLARSAARYSPDGKTIATLGSTLRPEAQGLIDPSRFAASFELGLLDLDGGAYRVLCHEPDLSGGPICWSPDSRQILFARFDSREKAIAPEHAPAGDILSIWSIGRDGGGLRQVTGGWCPDWRSARSDASPTRAPTGLAAPSNPARSSSSPSDGSVPAIEPDQATTALKQFGLGLSEFQHARPVRSAGVRSRLPVDRQASWVVTVLPQIGRDDLHKGIHSSRTDGEDRPWDDAANRDAIGTVLAPLVTPDMASSGATRDASGAGRTGFVGVSGTGPDSPGLPEGSRDPARGFFGYHRIARPAEVTDGTSSTVMLMEARSRRGPWAQNGPSTVRPIESFEGGLVLMADGSVRTLTRSTDRKLLQSMSTIAAED